MNTWKDGQHCSLWEKCNSKLQWDIISHWSKWPSSKNPQTTSAGESEEKREILCTAHGNINWCSHCGKHNGNSFKKTRNKTTISSVQLLSRVQHFATHVMQHARPPCPSLTPGVHPNSCPLSQWCHPTISSSVVPFSSCLQSFPASGSFQWVSSSHLVAKVLEFQLQHQSFQRTSGLISFRMDWLDLLAAQETLKSLLQHHSSKASILQHSAFFIVQLSHLYMTTEKNHWLDRPFFCKVMSLLFNMLSSLVITFLPRSLISWLQSPSAVILEHTKIKSDTVSTVSPSISHEVMGPDAMILVFWMLSLSQLFLSPLSLSSRGSLVLLHFLP